VPEKPARLPERLLEAEQSRQCQAHLENREACRADKTALGRLQARLAARGSRLDDRNYLPP
jgi:hypothetical protein